MKIAEEALGLDELARRLGVPPAAMADWRSGVAIVPHDKFLRLVDVVSGIDPKWERPKRVLVVDDNADAAVALCHLIDLLGHHATAVTDSRRALDIARDLRPEIAILDLNMPYVSGLDLARMFREDESLKDTPLVVLTAMDGPEYRQKTKEAGFKAHLRKPVDAAVLRQLIAEFQRQ